MNASQPGTVDPTFNPGRGALHIQPGAGTRVLIQPDGKIIVGGNFNGVGLAKVLPIIRFNPDGSLDPAFDASALALTEFSLSGATDFIPLALQPNGQILVGPDRFNQGYGTRALLRLNANGSLDASFNPAFEDDYFPQVRQVLVLASGKILVAGRFDSINGVARSNLARLNQDGGVDETFTAARTGYFQLQSTGKLIVSSGYRLNSDGSLDTSFSADVPVVPSGYGKIGSLLVQPDDKIVYSQGLNFDGDAVVRRLNVDGSQDGSFAPFNQQFASLHLVQMDGRIIVSNVRLNTDGTVDKTFQPTAIGLSVAQQSDGKLVTADRFSAAPHGIRRLLLNGGLDQTFNTKGGLTIIGNAEIARGALLPDGRIAVVGPFTHVNRVPRRSLAVLQRDGTVDLAFDTGNLIAPEPNGELSIGSVVAQPDGKLLIAFNGEFVRLNSDGTLDTTFHFSPIKQIYSYIQGVVLQPDGRILVSGPDGFVRLLPNGKRDPSFTSGVQNAVAMFVEPDGKIMVRGGQQLATRLRPDGSIDTEFPGVGGAPSFDRVYAIARPADGKYLVSRSDIAGSRHDVLFRLNSDGTADPSFSADVASVQFMVLDETGITVAGNVAILAEASEGENRVGVVRLNFDGSRDGTFALAQFNSGASLTELLMDKDRNLVLTGEFTTVNGIERHSVVKLIGGAPRQLANISTRSRVSAGESVAISGFIIVGNTPKKVIIRALGPSLAQNSDIGADTLPNPKISLYDETGVAIAENDNWRDTQESEIAATGIPPSSDTEAAIVRTLAPGSYTAVVQDSADGEGLAVVELYDLKPSADSALANISTRGTVGAGERVMIGGFILHGSEPSTVVVRALGPSLSAAGVDAPLSNPFLAVYDQFGEAVFSNDDWAQMQQADLTAVGLAPQHALEAAILTRLRAGAYTAVIRACHAL